MRRAELISGAAPCSRRAVDGPDACGGDVNLARLARRQLDLMHGVVSGITYGTPALGARVGGVHLDRPEHQQYGSDAWQC